MSSVVLDASAILAFIKNEPGTAVVDEVIGEAIVSAVNLAEIASKLAGDGASVAEVRLTLATLPIQVADFDFEFALRTGLLRPLTARRGLSLGDRACLALGLQRRLPVLTADRAWSGLELGVDVRLIR